MNDELAQSIALALYGTAYLKGTLSEEAFTQFEDSNPAFQTTLSLRFEDEERNLIAEKAINWLKHVKEQGAQRVMVRRPWNTAQLASTTHYAGTGGLQLGSQGRITTQWWQSFWKPSRKAMMRQASLGTFDADSQRVWLVVHRAASKARGNPPLQITYAHARKRLLEALDAALKTGEEIPSVKEWLQQLKMARSQLEKLHPAVARELSLPESTPEEAQQLLVCAALSWVFGGVGSWNNSFVEDPVKQKDFADITRELFGAVLSAFEVGVDTATAV